MPALYRDRLDPLYKKNSAFSFYVDKFDENMSQKDLDRCKSQTFSPFPNNKTFEDFIVFLEKEESKDWLINQFKNTTDDNNEESMFPTAVNAMLVELDTDDEDFVYNSDDDVEYEEDEQESIDNDNESKKNNTKKSATKSNTTRNKTPTKKYNKEEEIKKNTEEKLHTYASATATILNSPIMKPICTTQLKSEQNVLQCYETLYRNYVIGINETILETTKRNAVRFEIMKIIENSSGKKFKYSQQSMKKLIDQYEAIKDNSNLQTNNKLLEGLQALWKSENYRKKDAKRIRNCIKSLKENKEKN